MKRPHLAFSGSAVFLSALVTGSWLRVVFLLYHQETFRTCSPGSIGRAFTWGVLADGMVLFIMMGIALLPQLAVSGFRKTWKVRPVALEIAAWVFLLLNGIDPFYFTQFDARLNGLVFAQFSQFGPIFTTMAGMESLLAFPLVVGSVIGLFHIQIRLLLRMFRKVSLRPVWLGAICFAFAFLVSGLYLPGPLWRSVAFPEGQALTQLAINAPYSLVRSFWTQMEIQSSGGRFTNRWMPDEEALDITQKLVFEPGDSAISSFNPFIRNFHPSNPAPETFNIVLVLMEGFSASFVSTLNDSFHGLSPNLDRWSQKGWYFERFFAHETRTHHALYGAVAGFPSLLNMFISHRRGTESFETVASLLRRRNFQTSFYYGYSAEFDNMGFFLKQGGIERIVDGGDFTHPRWKGPWGVSDEDLFDKALADCDAEAARGPFFSLLLSSTSHQPYRVPEYFSNQHPELADLPAHYQTFAYSDWALGRFLDSLATRSWFQKTIVVVTGDHGELFDPRDRVLKRFQIPCLITGGPFLSDPKTITGPASQADLPATLLDAIGYEGPAHVLGRSLLRNPERPHEVFMRHGQEVFHLRDSLLLRYDLDADHAELFRTGAYNHLGSRVEDAPEKAELTRQLQAVLQSASWLVFHSRYRIPGRLEFQPPVSKVP